MDPLLAALRRVRRRLGLVRALEAALAGALVGGAVAAALTVLRIFAPRVLTVSWSHPALPLLWMVVGLTLGFVIRLAMGVSLRGAAMAADRAGGLKERLATALEVLDRAASESAGGKVRLLDAKLLEQARAVAARLDVKRFRFARSAGPRGRVVLLVFLGLVIGAFIPSAAGPAVPSDAAVQAVGAIEDAVGGLDVAAAIRREVDEALAVLRRSGARLGEADRVTTSVYRAAAEARRRRDEAARALAAVENREVRRMVWAAGRGNGSGAAAAAGDLAERLSKEPNEGGLAVAERERLADDLAGAAAKVRACDLSRLAAELEAAAESVRRPGSATDETLEGLASALVRSVGEGATRGVAATVAAVRQARRALGLADAPPALPAGVLAALEPDAARSDQPPGGERAAYPEFGERGAGPASESRPIPPEVQPEDRDVVRRYFGG